MFFQLTKLFLKLANSLEDSNLMEYLSTFDTTNDKSISKWIIKNIDKFDLDYLEKLARLYIKNKDGLKNILDYSVSDLGLELGFTQKNPDVTILDDSGNNVPNGILDIALDLSGAKELAGSGGSFLGRGQFGDVYEVNYEGKRCAMKICDVRDLRGYIYYSDLAERIPSVLRKHFPKIYYINRFKDGDVDYGVVIMELLEPLPKGLKYHGWGTIHNEEDRDHMIFNYYYVLRSGLYQAITDQLFETIDIKNIKLYNIKRLNSYNDLINPEVLFENLNFNMQYNLIFNRQTLHTWVDRYFKLGIKRIFNELIQYSNMGNDSLKLLNDSVIESVLDRMKLNLDLQEFKIPINNDTAFRYDRYFSRLKERDSSRPDERFNDKRLNDLYNALSIFSNNRIMEFNDIHQNNVMYRPSDDSLVIVDLGLFGTR